MPLPHDRRNLFTAASVSVERMLLISASTMNRKSLALAIVLLIAGLAPAAAIIGFCTRMPCCWHAADAAAFATQRNDCCTTITCYDTPSAKLTNRTSSIDFVFAAPALVVVAVTPAAPVLTREVIDTSPPVPVRHRLAVLSILLI